jgi:hypothetical protein
LPTVIDGNRCRISSSKLILVLTGEWFPLLPTHRHSVHVVEVVHGCVMSNPYPNLFVKGGGSKEWTETDRVCFGLEFRRIPRFQFRMDILEQIKKLLKQGITRKEKSRVFCEEWWVVCGWAVGRVIVVMAMKRSSNLAVSRVYCN